jgi:hypothetical protein
VSAAACTRLEELLRLREEDRLSLPEQRLLREHLASCDACAAEALRRDPVLLFALDAGPEAPEADARERFVEDVLASVAAARAGRRLRSAHVGVGLRIAASLLLAASVAGVWLLRDRGETGPGDRPLPVAQAPRTLAEPAEPVPALEGLGSVGAVVYQFPATTPGEPTVVFVVDRNADI